VNPRYRIYLDPSEWGEELVVSPCEGEAEHTPAPRGYIEWHEWAEAMTQTHKQEKCSGCDKWAIWVPR
jgi:hypothetical protein